MKRQLLLASMLMYFGITNAQISDSVPVHLLLDKTVYLVKVNGKNIGQVKDLKVAKGINRISVYTPFEGVFDTTMQFSESVRKNLIIRFVEIPEYRAEVSKFNVQVSKLVIGIGAVAVAPFAIRWFVQSRKDYLETYKGVEQAADNYERAITKYEISAAEKGLVNADRTFSEAKKKYETAMVFSAVGVGFSLVGAYLIGTVKFPKIEDRAKLRFDAISINGNQYYPGVYLTVSL